MKRMAHTNTTFFLKLNLIVGVRTNKGKKGKSCLQLWHCFNLQRQESAYYDTQKPHNIYYLYAKPSFPLPCRSVTLKVYTHTPAAENIHIYEVAEKSLQ